MSSGTIILWVLLAVRLRLSGIGLEDLKDANKQEEDGEEEGLVTLDSVSMVAEIPGATPAVSEAIFGIVTNIRSCYQETSYQIKSILHRTQTTMIM